MSEKVVRFDRKVNKIPIPIPDGKPLQKYKKKERKTPKEIVIAIIPAEIFVKTFVELVVPKCETILSNYVGWSSKPLENDPCHRLAILRAERQTSDDGIILSSIIQMSRNKSKSKPISAITALFTEFLDGKIQVYIDIDVSICGNNLVFSAKCVRLIVGKEILLGKGLTTNDQINFIHHVREDFEIHCTRMIRDVMKLPMLNRIYKHCGLKCPSVNNMSLTQVKEIMFSNG
jgi:hypothetical protein